jgi:hypothetical protein
MKGVRIALAHEGPARVAPLLVASVLSACGNVSLKPEAVLPKPLIVPIPAEVGLIIPAETRRYVDKETRFGIDWKVELGPGEVRLMRDVFKDLFQRVEEFKDLQTARAGKDLKALFETPLLRSDHSISHRPVHTPRRESRQLHADRIWKFARLGCVGR